MGPAGKSLGSGDGCLRIGDVLDRGQIVLFSLDFGSYPESTRRLAGWAFLGLQAQLSKRQQQTGRPQCLVLVDEAHRVGWTGRLAVDLMATGRSAGVSVILSSQGPSDLDDLGRHLLERAAQDAAWVMMYRQGTLDSDRASRMLGLHLVEDRSWSEGPGGTREQVRLVERPWATVSQLEELRPGDAFLRVPAVDDRDVRVEHLRVALPRPNVTALPRVVPSVVLEPIPLEMGETRRPESTLLMPRVIPALGVPPRALPPGGTNGESGQSEGVSLKGYPPRGSSRDEARFWSKVERGVCGCWFWVAKDVNKKTGYGKIKVGGKSVGAHRFAYESLFGPIPEGYEVDHCCPCEHGPNKLCMRHLQAVPKPTNLELRWDREAA